MSTNCGGHSIIIKQIKAKGSKIHMNSMSVNLPGEVAFSTRSFKNTYCVLLWTMKKLKWHVWSAHWNMNCPSANRHWNSTQHKIKLPPFSFTFFIKFHLKVSCPMTQEDWDLVAIIFVVMRWFHCPGSQYYRLLLLPAFHVHLYNKNAFLDTKARKK